MKLNKIKLQSIFDVIIWAETKTGMNTFMFPGYAEADSNLVNGTCVVTVYTSLKEIKNVSDISNIRVEERLLNGVLVERKVISADLILRYQASEDEKAKPIKLYTLKITVSLTEKEEPFVINNNYTGDPRSSVSKLNKILESIKPPITSSSERVEEIRDLLMEILMDLKNNYHLKSIEKTSVDLFINILEVDDEDLDVTSYFPEIIQFLKIFFIIPFDFKEEVKEE